MISSIFDFTGGTTVHDGGFTASGVDQ